MWMSVDNALTPHPCNGKVPRHAVDKKCGQMCRKTSDVIFVRGFFARVHALVFQQI
jgi:hypothetical protein